METISRRRGLLPLPTGEKVGARGIHSLESILPLTRIALQSDLSPVGRGDAARHLFFA